MSLEGRKLLDKEELKEPQACKMMLKLVGDCCWVRGGVGSCPYTDISPFKLLMKSPNN